MAVANKSAENTLIKASVDGKLNLHHLPAADELLLITTYLNSRKPCTFLWKGCN